MGETVSHVYEATNSGLPHVEMGKIVVEGYCECLQMGHPSKYLDVVNEHSEFRVDLTRCMTEQFKEVKEFELSDDELLDFWNC